MDFLFVSSLHLEWAIAGVPGKKPLVTSDKLLESPSKFLVFACEIKGEFDLTSKVT